MTSEEIRAAIARLKALSSGCRIYTSTEVVNAVASGDWVSGLIEILEQSDPDTHVELPRDADGVPIRIGDELEYLGYDGVWREPFAVDELRLHSDGWEVRFDGVYDELISRCRHYHAPTVEDVLREYGDEVRRCCDTEDTIAEYAEKLREVMDGE